MAALFSQTKMREDGATDKKRLYPSPLHEKVKKDERRLTFVFWLLVVWFVIFLGLKLTNTHPRHIPYDDELEYMDLDVDVDVHDTL